MTGIRRCLSKPLGYVDLTLRRVTFLKKSRVLTCFVFLRRQRKTYELVDLIRMPNDITEYLQQPLLAEKRFWISPAKLLCPKTNSSTADRRLRIPSHLGLRCPRTSDQLLNRSGPFRRKNDTSGADQFGASQTVAPGNAVFSTR